MDFRRRGTKLKRTGHALALTALFALLLCSTNSAKADDHWLLSVEAGALIPFDGTGERFGPGGDLGLAGYYGVTDWFLTGLRLRAGLLSDGPPPGDERFVDPGMGDLYTANVLLRFRPIPNLGSEDERATGMWVEIGIGGALTGSQVRPAAEATLGWGFRVDEIVVAPFVRWSTIIEVDNPLDQRPAQLLGAGIDLTFFDEHHEEIVEPVIGDTDGDGIFDDVDECTNEPEDLDGFQDEDGCPEPDNDSDGINDDEDQCPFDPEDVDGFRDEDGCPEPDNDEDGLLDPDDQCPNDAEVINGIDDDDGCPDEGLIRFVDDRVVLQEEILFDFNDSRIKGSARPVLRAIVELARQHPEWIRLRVEGHTDVRGAHDFNQRLSEARAHRVRDALVQYGIPGAMIDAVGQGETRPRSHGDEETNHQQNRRVEFVVLARREVTRVVTSGERRAPQAEPASDSDAASSPDTPEPTP